MKNLPTLYSRTATGAIQVWTMYYDGNKYWSVEGLQGGKETVNSPTVTTGKNLGRANETTPEQQAELEARSKWEKKKKSGGYWEDIKDIDQTTFVEPMLAKSLKDHPKKVIFPCILDRKYNGGRVITHKGGQYSRKGEKYATIPHIWESLKPLFEKYPNLVLDGEGYNHDYRYKLNELMHILRTTKKENITPELLAESKAKVKLYVYDGYGWDSITENTGCQKRREGLKKLLKDIPYIVVVPYVVANNLEEVYKNYQDFIDDGYEGAIIRNSDASYQHKRTSDLLKVKPEDDDEGIIVDIKEGVGNWSGTGKVITIKWKDKIFDATFKGSIPQGVQFLKDKDRWIGKTVTFLYNNLTGYGVPNYARVDINNCLKS